MLKTCLFLELNYSKKYNLIKLSYVMTLSQ